LIAANIIVVEESLEHGRTTPAFSRSIVLIKIVCLNNRRQENQNFRYWPEPVFINTKLLFNNGILTSDLTARYISEYEFN
jgi:hypothetical protein